MFSLHFSCCAVLPLMLARSVRVALIIWASEGEVRSYVHVMCAQQQQHSRYLIIGSWASSRTVRVVTASYVIVVSTLSRSPRKSRHVLQRQAARQSATTPAGVDAFRVFVGRGSAAVCLPARQKPSDRPLVQKYPPTL